MCASSRKRTIPYLASTPRLGANGVAGAEEVFEVTVHVILDCFRSNKSHKVAHTCRQGYISATSMGVYGSMPLSLIVLTWRRAEFLRIAHHWTWR